MNEKKPFYKNLEWIVGIIVTILFGSSVIYFNMGDGINAGEINNSTIIEQAKNQNNEPGSLVQNCVGECDQTINYDAYNLSEPLILTPTELELNCGDISLGQIQLLLTNRGDKPLFDVNLVISQTETNSTVSFNTEQMDDLTVDKNFKVTVGDTINWYPQLTKIGYTVDGKNHELIKIYSIDPGQTLHFKLHYSKPECEPSKEKLQFIIASFQETPPQIMGGYK